MSERQDLYAKLENKNREILNWVVGSFGLGDVATIKPDRRRSLSNDFDDFLGMLFEGYGREDFRAIDARVLATDIGRLVQQRREIVEQRDSRASADA